MFCLPKTSSDLTPSSSRCRHMLTNVKPIARKYGTAVSVVNTGRQPFIRCRLKSTASSFKQTLKHWLNSTRLIGYRKLTDFKRTLISASARTYFKIQISMEPEIYRRSLQNLTMWKNQNNNNTAFLKFKSMLI